MALNIWNNTGFVFDLDERTTLNNQLPVNYSHIPDPEHVKFTVISGELPPGVRLDKDRFIGTPFEVARTTKFSFVIRAKYKKLIADRTFTVQVFGPDDPFWTTQPGLLPVGPGEALYVHDSTYIDFYLEGIDYDTATGQPLLYTIYEDDGELPPGLVLMPNGRIVGFIQPLLAIILMEGNGNYDTSIFDTLPYDLGFRPSNGFDSFVYDLVGYDLTLKNLYPKKLNRNYEFIASITDGDSIAKRKFRIYVVGEDHFRADSTANSVGEGTYTADVTYVKAPIWVTPSNLGVKRANNYQTFVLDIYDDPDNGPVIYRLDYVNPLIFGTCRKELTTDNAKGLREIRIENTTSRPEIGQKLCFDKSDIGVVSKTYQINGITDLGSKRYRLSVYPPLEQDLSDNLQIKIGTPSVLPPGMQFDQGTGEVFGVVPYMPAITKEYNFTITAIRLSLLGETASSFRTFTVKLMGEIENSISWITKSTLDDLDANIISTLSIKATSSIEDAILLYRLVGGKLPNGLSLTLAGDIIGRPTQYGDNISYRGTWSETSEYTKNDVVSFPTIENVRSAMRYKNIATVVIENDVSFEQNETINVNTSEISLNKYDDSTVLLDDIKIWGVKSSYGSEPWFVEFEVDNRYHKQVISGDTVSKTIVLDNTINLSVGMTLSGYGFEAENQPVIKIKKILEDGVSVVLTRAPYYTPTGTVTFHIPLEQRPLAPNITKITGNSSNSLFGLFYPVSPSRTSGNGTGASFYIIKDGGSTDYLSNVKVYVIDPGQNYKPGDIITISGSDLGGNDIENDLIFTVENGLEFYFNVTGNSNQAYNGRFLAVDNTASTITLMYPENPGVYGLDTIERKIKSNISSISRLSDIATVITEEDHLLETGDIVTVLCKSDKLFSTSFAEITVINSKTFTYANDSGFSVDDKVIERAYGFVIKLEKSTRLAGINYFRYRNDGPDINMRVVTGEISADPVLYKAVLDNNEFNAESWEPYDFKNARFGLTTIDKGDFTLDGETTFCDRKFTFEAEARDALGTIASVKEFTVIVNSPNDREYSNLIVKPFLKENQRALFKEFITNSSIFDVRYIYRLSDPSFGIQSDLKMLIYAGIETKTASEVALAIRKNHQPKRFKLGDVKVAEAKIPGTNTVVYETIYVDVIDPLESGKKHLPELIYTTPNPFKITVDQTNEFNYSFLRYPSVSSFPEEGSTNIIYIDTSTNKYYRYVGVNNYNASRYTEYNPDTPTFRRANPLLAKVDRSDVFAGDPGTRIKFPSSVYHWRNRIKQLGLTERHYLPLWMRTIQTGTFTELGFVKAIPLCFCLPGTSNEIYLNIKNSGFDFKQIDYVVDRYIIDQVTGDNQDKYIVFKNDRTTII
jgi:hypothetical protein